MSVLPDITIKIGSEEIVEFISISLHQEVLRQHLLTISIRRDHFENPNQPIFKISQKLIGEPAKVTIRSPYNEKTEFAGIVTEIKTTRSEENGGDIIDIFASSPDIVLADKSDYQSFSATSINDVIQTCLDNYSVKTKTKIAASPNKRIHYITQFDESAFSFISRLAVRYGQWFLYDGTTLYFGALPRKATTLEYGKDLFRFDFSLKLTSFFYDYIAHDHLTNDSHSINAWLVSRKVPKISKPAFDKSKQVYSHHTNHYFQSNLKDTQVNEDLLESTRLSKAASVANLVVCSASSDNPDLSLGSIVELTEQIEDGENTQKLNHGKFRIIGLDHKCDHHGNYHNEFVAIPSDVESPPYTNPDLYVIAEPHSAVVVDNADPDGIGRVRVQFFWQGVQQFPVKTPWIRIATPHAGKNKGFHFIPEVGEEVLVGFEGGNIDKPYVMGSLYNGQNKALKDWKNKDNNFKAIRTRSGHTIEFIDESNKEAIKIYDGDRDKYTYSISLNSHSKEIIIEAKGDMDIKADNIKISANKTFELKAQNIKQTAGQKMETKASTGLSLDGGTSIQQKASTKISIDGGVRIEQKAGIIEIN